MKPCYQILKLVYANSENAQPGFLGFMVALSTEVPFLWLHLYIVIPPLRISKNSMVLSLRNDVLSTSVKAGLFCIDAKKGFV